MTPTPEQIAAALAFFEALPGCSDTQKHGKALAEEVLALRADVERQSALVAAFVDPGNVNVTGIVPIPGGITMGLQGGAAKLLAEAFAEQFRESGAVNYLDVEMISDDPAIGRLLVTIQRLARPTAHDLRKEAERTIERMKTQLAALPAGEQTA